MLAALLTTLWLAQQMPAGPTVESHRREVEAWRSERLARLRGEGGWLTLAGLYWLKPGVNRFGADRSNDLVLPARAPARAGTFRLASGRVTVEALPGTPLTLAGKPITRAELRSDASGAPDVVTLGDLTLQVIARGERLGIRVKDPQSPVRQGFKGLSWFPVRPEYKVSARFVAHPAPVSIAVPTVIGTTETMPSPGSALFELGGKSVRLDPVLEPGEPRLFFIFRDATSGRSTYGGGRFLYADPPADGHGQIVLDFNKAYSPPCAFTPYATCPLPPPQNRLPIAIEAGELAPPSGDGAAHH